MRKLYEFLKENVSEVKDDYTYSSLADEVHLTGEQKDKFVKFMSARFPNKEGTDWGYHKTWAERFKRREEWAFSDSESRAVLKSIGYTGEETK